jgi:death-on-curing protein
MYKLSFEDLVYIHDRIIKESGGLPGIKNEGLVHSALARPFQTAFGKQIHPSIFQKAAALLDSIANHHCFNDASKRTAMAAASFFLFLNQESLLITDAEYEAFMLHVVEDKPSVQDISSWLKKHCGHLNNLPDMLQDEN